MARPKTDIAAARRTMLEATERLLRAHGRSKITVSEVAAACRMSQSNAYRFFPSKQALLEAVGERWFAEIEEAVAKVAASDLTPDEQVVRFMVRQYEVKRARYNDDPMLFAAYLDLGHANMAVVERHLKRLHAQLLAIVVRCAERALLGGRKPQDAAVLIEAMTARFRDPGQIMRFHKTDSAARVGQAVRIILAGLAHPAKSR